MRKREKIRNLKRTQKLLQRAHDVIETRGFDISRYVGRPVGGPSCYIGTVRELAGVHPIPGQDPAEGDGPELRLALKALDEVARRRARRRGLISELEAWEREPGRLIEALGLTSGQPEGKQAGALKIFRAALTDVHKQLEALDA